MTDDPFKPTGRDDDPDSRENSEPTEPREREEFGEPAEREEPFEFQESAEREEPQDPFGLDAAPGPERPGEPARPAAPEDSFASDEADETDAIEEFARVDEPKETETPEEPLDLDRPEEMEALEESPVPIEPEEPVEAQAPAAAKDAAQFAEPERRSEPAQPQETIAPPPPPPAEPERRAEPAQPQETIAPPPPPPAEPKKPSDPRWLYKLQMALIFFVLLVHPSAYAINLGAEGGRHVLASLDLLGANVLVTLADIFLLAALAVYVVRYFVRRQWNDLPRVPLPVWLLLGWFLLSGIPALKGAFGERVVIDRVSFAKTFAQLFAYLFVAYFLLRKGFECPSFRRWAPLVILLQATAVVAWAWWQYVTPEVEVMLVSGSLATRNSFGATLAMMVPFALGVGLFGGRRTLLVWSLLLLVASLPVTLAAGPLAAVCLAALIVTWLRRPAGFVVLGVVLLAALLVGLPILSQDRDTFPWARDNMGILTDSTLLYRRGDPYRTLQWTRYQPADSGAERFPGKGEEWAWRQKVKEWQVALLMVSRSPVFGVGGGSFVANIAGAGYYNNPFSEWSMPKAAEDLMEEGTQNFYLTMAATIGLPALFLILWLLLQHATAGAVAMGPRDPASGAGAGVLAALLGFALVASFADPMVRGAGLTFVIMLALAASLPKRALVEQGEAQRLPRKPEAQVSPASM